MTKSNKIVIHTPDAPSLDERSIRLRQEILKTVDNSRRGHIGSAFSLVEIIRVLYDDILHVDPKHPKWPERDRFILSKGHGCLALYVLLAEKGFFSRGELYTFCMFDSLLGGHPDGRKISGVEASTGSLGHGLSIGVGMAMAARIDKKSYRTFVVTSDAECNEGSTWEAALAIKKHNLTNLFVLLDYNKMQSYGTTTDVLDLEPLRDKWESFGFSVREVNGHDVKALHRTIKQAMDHPKVPQMIICHTVKGRGVDFMESNAKWHHKTKISDEEMTKISNSLDIKL